MRKATEAGHKLRTELAQLKTKKMKTKNIQIKVDFTMHVGFLWKGNTVKLPPQSPPQYGGESNPSKCHSLLSAPLPAAAHV